MPRPKLPISLYIANDKHHKSKKSLELRQEAEKKMSLGVEIGEAPELLKIDPTAYGKWNELRELYSGFEFVSTADTDVLIQYCFCYSEYMDLQKERFSKEHDKGYDKLDHMINKKSDLLQKLGSKIFLDPMSRVKAVPTPENKPEQSEAEKMGFGGI